MSKENAAAVIDDLYLHIGNGGVKFAVEDSGLGPEVVIESSHFGNNVHSQRLMVDQHALVGLRDLFAKALAHAEAGAFSEVYCHAATDSDAGRVAHAVADEEPKSGGPTCV